MRCRNLYIGDDSTDIVWFGSYGKNADGTAKKADNYVQDKNAVSYSLIPRLSIIKGELWYQVNYGLPLLDKIRSKDIFDTTIIDMILIHPQVSGIKSFTSSVENHQYTFDVKINSIYNTEVEVSSADSNSQLYV